MRELTDKESQAIEKWTEVAYKKGEEIDPDDRHDWDSMATGFFLALGFSVSETEDLVIIIIELQLI